MKLISWNVNGLRACIKKGFLDFFNHEMADIFCIQETKMQEGQIDFYLDGYNQYWDNALKKGYSGTAIFTKKVPLKIQKGMGIAKHDTEGRMITLEFDNFFLVNVYAPNSKAGLARLDYRMTWQDDFKNYLGALKKEKEVIVCGDLNVAYQEIDLKNPKTNRKSAGFTDEEREKFGQLLNEGFIDTYRYLYPDKIEYTWWSYMRNSRERNSGWRIDYFLTSDSIKNNILDVKIHTNILGSDHCPVELQIKL